MHNVPEEVLVKKCKDGDIEAFEELISKYQKKIFNIALRILEKYEDAEDISQDIFVKVFKCIGSFKEQSSFYTWVYRITVNECMDAIKSRRKKETYSIDAPVANNESDVVREIQDKSESIEDKVERKEIREYIEQGLKKLSVEFRTVLVLRDIQGFSYDEIAQMTDCPFGTVKSRINRARHELKEILSANKELFTRNNV